MKSMTIKNENFHRIEFWATTAIFVFALFFHITHALGSRWTDVNSTVESSVPFNFYFVATLIRYTLLYLSFLALNFYIVPALVKRENPVQNTLFTILLYILLSFLFGSINSYLKYDLYRAPVTGYVNYTIIFQKSFLYIAWLLLLFGFYSVIKYTSLYLLSNSDHLHQKYPFIAPGALIAFVLWMITMFLFLAVKADPVVSTLWAVVVPFAIVFYCYSFYSLIPVSLTKKKPFRSYLGRTILLLLIAFFPVFLLAMALTYNPEGGMAVSSFNTAFQLVVFMPLTWYLYKRHLRGNEELATLKKELGQSNASFDFLRSQINPHFLFNALNTIYGTALQEGAERTGEGIERLGDMMRFMLQENMQDKIALARELDYVRNYISLQQLRTDTNPDITIQSDIEEQVNTVQIAPMLLIPFVENAFKHGISFREPSYITITLETRDSTLYFDVANSKHIKVDNDPEQHQSGIGLSNVQQRLHQLYPGRHELTIRETKKDFFIHLTLQLT